MAVSKPHWQSGTGASSLEPLSNHELGGHRSDSGFAGGGINRPPLLVGSKRSASSRGLRVMEAWGFQYKSNLIWHKIQKDGGSDGRGVGFYFRNVTEIILFGVRGKNARILDAGRRQVNMIQTQKREHSRKPDEQYQLIESCSPGPYLELFSRGVRKNWTVWGNQADESYSPDWNTYKNHSRAVA